jgi:hypothetical protein
MALLSVGLSTLIGSLVSSIRHQAGMRERTLAMDAIETTLEQLAGVPFAEIFARFNGVDGDDILGGPIGSPGLAFDVPGLGPVAGDADGLVGRLEFPGDGSTLREDFQDVELGPPRDLNGDGLVDQADHAGDYRVLPVRIVVEWNGIAGPSRLTATTSSAGR